MPIIDVSLIEGRSRERKAALIAELTDAAERVLEVPRASIRVLLREIPAEHWGIGGTAAGSKTAREAPAPRPSKRPRAKNEASRKRTR